jgi:hypothetical protein
MMPIVLYVRKNHLLVYHEEHHDLEIIEVRQLQT